MKLMRCGPLGAEKPVLVDRGGGYRDLSGVISDLSGAELAPEALARLSGLVPEELPTIAEPGRIGACVANVGKFIGIGLNYRDHAEEAGMPIPDEPILFMKATSSICGPNDSTVPPRGSTKLDWEVELGVVVGTEGSYIPEERALDHVAGYCVVNDVSERAFQLEGTGQWVKGKSADSFGPIGPWLVTKDDVPDPQGLALWTEVNGERRQNGHTNNMIFTVAQLVSKVSGYMTLMPGDVIATGTPPGVGLGMKPPQFLQPGDRVRVSVEGLGVQEQEIQSPA